ncbi:MAG: K(+)-transporting ATPase subunit F [Planctomycetaceae bacterium]
MDWTTILALVVTLALLAYLIVALLAPERFS